MLYQAREERAQEEDDSEEEVEEEEEPVSDNDLVKLSQIENLRFFIGNDEIEHKKVQGMIAHSNIGVGEIWLNIWKVSDVKARKKGFEQLHWLDAVVEEKTSILRTWIEKNEHNRSSDVSTKMACSLLREVLWNDDYLEKAGAEWKIKREEEAAAQQNEE